MEVRTNNIKVVTKRSISFLLIRENDSWLRDHFKKEWKKVALEPES